MTTLEILGFAGIGAVFLLFTAQMAFAWGYAIATRKERQLADRRVRGVLAELNNSSPRSSRLTYRKVNPKHVGYRRYCNSKLPGEVLS
jgi:hypothetical protein